MANPRKTNAQKALEGTLRADRYREEAAFTLLDGGVDRPDWVTGPDAVDEWDARVEQLQDARVLTEADLSMLAHYCNLSGAMIGKWRDEKVPSGTEFKELRALSGLFGFDPAHRHIPAAGKAKNASDPLAKLRAMK